MSLKKLTITVAVASLLSGCAAKQEITQFNGKIPSQMCIAKHSAVKEGVLVALQKGLNSHGIKTSVINGSYIEKHGMWQPNVNPEEAKNCGAVVFYSARWSWDLATYMSFANIWVTDNTLNNKVAQATYISRHGLDKFINAENKILELVDSMVTNNI